jgi:hypothetical protein
LAIADLILLIGDYALPIGDCRLNGLTIGDCGFDIADWGLRIGD